jgi:hypothetical protein
MSHGTKVILGALACLSFLGLWRWREKEDTVIDRYYINLTAERGSHPEILRNTNELSGAFKKYRAEEQFPKKFAAIDFDNGYVVLTPNRELVRVWTKLGTKIVLLKRPGSNGLGVTIVRGKNDVFFKFTDEK